MYACLKSVIALFAVTLTNCAAPTDQTSSLNAVVCGSHNGVTTLCSEPSDNFVKYRWNSSVWKSANQFGQPASVRDDVCSGIRGGSEQVGPFAEEDDEFECRTPINTNGWQQMGGEFPGQCMVYGPYLNFQAPPAGKVHAFTAFIRTEYAKWSSEAYVDIEITAGSGTKVISRERWSRAAFPRGGIKSHFGTAEGALTGVEVRICNNKFAYLTLSDITLKHEFVNKGDLQ